MRPTAAVVSKERLSSGATACWEGQSAAAARVETPILVDVLDVVAGGLAEM